uniref:Uncharacterized protein n=1 Tax=Populus trichocarpa TaxID=3694 RepID=A9P9J9_POPTR|nr:unknown [Populus trichocarpa]
MNNPGSSIIPTWLPVKHFTLPQKCSLQISKGGAPCSCSCSFSPLTLSLSLSLSLYLLSKLCSQAPHSLTETKHFLKKPVSFPILSLQVVTLSLSHI